MRWRVSSGRLLAVVVVVTVSTLAITLTVRARSNDTSMHARSSESSSSDANGGPSWLAAVAYQAAAQNGDPSPVSVVFAKTDSLQVAPLVGLRVGDLGADHLELRYVVVMTGRFTHEVPSHRAGQNETVTGSWIVLSVDPTTQQVKDFGIGEDTLDTSCVGRLTPLSR